MNDNKIINEFQNSGEARENWFKIENKNFNHIHIKLEEFDGSPWFLRIKFECLVFRSQIWTY